MTIKSLPHTADPENWQLIAQQQHAIAKQQSALAEQRQMMVLETQAIVAQQQKTLAEQAQYLAEKDAFIAKLKTQIAQLKKLQFGPTAESFSAEEKELLTEALEEDIATTEQELSKLLSTPRQQPKRQPLPSHLPREPIAYPTPEVCQSCGGALRFVREEVSEQLEYVPGHFVVKRHVRPVCSCRQCDSMTTPDLPAQIIDKGIPGPGLLAQVAINKYADHLPLYRQQKIFARSGIDLPRSTLTDWIAATGLALSPLVDAMKTQLLTQPILHADETTVKVLAPGKGKTKTAYLWLYRSHYYAAEQIVVYDFQDSRAGIHAQHFLKTYAGALMVDDYSGYKALFTTPFAMTELGCWAHVRRKFFDLFTANKSAYAQEVLAMIQKLYAIERDAQEMGTKERLAYRRKQAQPIITALEQWLTEKKSQVSVGSGLAKAINYALGRWPALIRYLEHGDYPIDNNAAENSVRPIALGRKNWLFSGSIAAGKRAANIMSLIETAKLNGLDPFAYLRDVLSKLPTWPNSRLGELLPYYWQPDSS